MIAETREDNEKDYHVSDDCIQAMESMLRQEFDYNSIMQMQDDTVIRRLAMKGYDWCNKNVPSYLDKVDFYDLAKEALERYKENWKGKEQGEDDRGHRFGKKNPK